MIETSILMNSIINDSNRPGEAATEKVYFGDNSRYALAGIHSRSGEIYWFIWDAEHKDSTMEEAVIIFQCDNFMMVTHWINTHL